MANVSTCYNTLVNMGYDDETLSCFVDNVGDIGYDFDTNADVIRSFAWATAKTPKAGVAPFKFWRIVSMAVKQYEKELRGES